MCLMDLDVDPTEYSNACLPPWLYYRLAWAREKYLKGILYSFSITHGEELETIGEEYTDNFNVWTMHYRYGHLILLIII